MANRRPSAGFSKASGMVWFEWLSMLVVVLVGYAIAAACRSPGEGIVDSYKHLPPWIRIGLPLFAVAFLLGPFLRRRIQKHDQASQTSRDISAQTNLESVQSGLRPKYAVYLRSFWLDGKAPTEYAEYRSEFIREPPQRDFEYLLAAALVADTPLIAIGRTGGVLGTGKVESDDASWEEKAKDLCRHATNIFMVPLDTPSTQWEVLMLKEKGLLNKTIFVMPPSSGPLFGDSELAVKWNKARQSYGAIGIEIPEYFELGQLFRLDQHGQLEPKECVVDGRVVAAPGQTGLADSNPEELRKLITKFVSYGEVCSKAEPCLTSKSCPSCQSTRSNPAQGQGDLFSLFSRYVRICDGCGKAYRWPPRASVELQNAIVPFLISLVFAWLCPVVFISVWGEYKSSHKVEFFLVAVGLLCGIASAGIFLLSCCKVIEAVAIIWRSRKQQK
jgi:hypothetical protein